jgi:hypothetical protein
MGFPILFTGPYVEWPVADAMTGWPEWYLEPRDEETLYLVNMTGKPQSAAVNGRFSSYVHRYLPLADRPGRPGRQLQWDFLQMNEVNNLSEVKPAAEMKWFAKAFAPELRRLAEYYGHEGLLRWGIVYLMD